jgi:hypothetical protein
MKKIGLVVFIIFLAFSLKAQQATAKINSSCASQPASLSVPSGKVAANFSIKTLVAGNNCYTGAAFSNKGFVIKASNGNIIYRYTRDSNGRVQENGGKLASLRLNSGTYTVWVDGGRGAVLVLNYRL